MIYSHFSKNINKNQEQHTQQLQMDMMALGKDKGKVFHKCCLGVKHSLLLGELILLKKEA